MRVLGWRWRPTPSGGAKTGGDSGGTRHGGVAAARLRLWHRRWSTSSAVVVEGRDGHTHWVMDIQPYPIQLFWVIPNS